MLLWDCMEYVRFNQQSTDTSWCWIGSAWGLWKDFLDLLVKGSSWLSPAAISILEKVYSKDFVCPIWSNNLVIPEAAIGTALLTEETEGGKYHPITPPFCNFLTRMAVNKLSRNWKWLLGWSGEGKVETLQLSLTFVDRLQCWICQFLQYICTLKK